MYKKKPVKQSTPKYKQWLIIAGVLFGMLGTGWLAYGYIRGDDLAALRALGEKMRDDSLSSEERRELRDQMRAQYEQLSDGQKQQLRDERELAFNRQDQARLTRFFAMAPEDREKELDRQIDEWDKRREEWEKRREERDRNGDGQRERGRGEAGGGGGGGGGGGPGGAGGRRGPMTGEQRLERTKTRLNNTTPEHRGMRSDYMREMQKRREARGLPPRGGRGGWR